MTLRYDMFKRITGHQGPSDLHQISTNLVNPADPSRPIVGSQFWGSRAGLEH